MKFQSPNYYHDAYFSKNNLVHSFHKKRIDRIMSYVPREKTVLDIGFGSGTVMLLAKKQKGCSVFGIDSNKRNVEFARKIGLKNVFNSDLSDFKLHRKFDIVICTDVIEHLNKKKQSNLIEQFCQHSKKSTRVILSFPSKAYFFFEPFWKVLRNIMNLGVVFDDQHYHAPVEENQIVAEMRQKNFILWKEDTVNLGLCNFLIFERVK